MEPKKAHEAARVPALQFGWDSWVAGDSGTATHLKAAMNALRVLWRNPLSASGFVIVAFLISIAILAPWLAPHDPLKLNSHALLVGPNRQFPFGTDELGRDILSRVIYGARPTLTIGLVVVAIAMGIGVPCGAISGYVGGRAEEVAMRITDIFLAFPAFILAMAIAAALGAGLTSTMLAVAVVRWPVYTRLVRGQVLTIKEREFVTAARCCGAGPLRIVRSHILPSCIPLLTVQASLDMGWIVIASAGLSFVGFGAQPPMAEWGSMISDGRQFVSTAWWYTAFPGLALLLSALGFNFLGDGLMELLDPRLRGRFGGRGRGKD